MMRDFDDFCPQMLVIDEIWQHVACNQATCEPGNPKCNRAVV